MKSITLRGALTWNGSERRSDRYGGIMLCTTVEHWSKKTPTIDLSSVKPFVGTRVQITAKVIESHKSSHVGDFFRGISPSKTRVGTLVDLGVGKIMAINVEGGFQSIIFCRDGREEMNDWMDPHVLYRLHDHLVDLIITDAADQPFIPAISENGKPQGDKDGFIMAAQPEPDGKGSYMQSKATFANE